MNVIDRIIAEVAGTIATNGIQELSKEERGGVSTFGYVRACLTATAYNAARTIPEMEDVSYGDFFQWVMERTDRYLNSKNRE